MMNSQICPNCQHQNRIGAKFCSGCGQELVGQEIPPTVATPSPQHSYTPCPYCGVNNQQGVARCVNCSRELFPSQQPYQQDPATVQASSPNRTILLIIIGVIAGLIVIVAGAYFILKELNPLDDVEDIIAPFETAIGTIDIDLTTLPESIETSLPDVLSTDIPLELPEEIPLEIPTDLPVSVPGLGIELPHLTDEEEIEIGREAAEEFERENPLSNDPVLTSRVEGIGNALLPYTPRQNLPYTFKVVDTNEINAFALPGGFIYVTRGMIEYVEEDHELAGVIGHELAHVGLRHSARLIENLAAANAALDLILSSSEELESIYRDNSTQLAIDAVATIVINGWGRENELDADQHGTIYMARANFIPREIIDLFSRMKEEEGEPSDPMSLMFSTHPPFSERIERVRETIDENQLGI